MEKRCLRREPADHFRTRRVRLQPTADGWDIQPVGEPLSFSELQALRQTGEIKCQGNARIFANLGVSLQLVIHHQGRKALALVQQQDVLKLVSGYVPSCQLDSPLQTAWAELMEEVLPLVEEAERCQGYSIAGIPLADPYGMARKGAVAITKAPLLSGQQDFPLTFSGESAGWPVSFYVHQPSASLQLVFPVAIHLPDNVTLVHVEDQLDHCSGEVLSLFDPDCPVILLELDKSHLPTGEMFTLNNGQWLKWQPGAARLSEFFHGPGAGLFPDSQM